MFKGFGRAGGVMLDNSRPSARRVDIGVSMAEPSSGSKAVVLVPQTSTTSNKGQLIAAVLMGAAVVGIGGKQYMDTQLAAQASTLTTSLQADKAAAVGKAAIANADAVDKAVTTALASQQAQFNERLNLEKANSYQQGIIDEHKKLRCQQVVVGNRDVGLIGGWLGNANTVWRGQNCQYTP